MKNLIVVLFLAGLTWGQPAMSTTHDIQLGCEARARVLHTTDPSSDDLNRANFTLGFIQGFVDATIAAGPNFDFPDSMDATTDAVCKYIDQHPEIWKLDRMRGMASTVMALYKR